MALLMSGQSAADTQSADDEVHCITPERHKFVCRMMNTSEASMSVGCIGCSSPLLVCHQLHLMIQAHLCLRGQHRLGCLPSEVPALRTFAISMTTAATASDLGVTICHLTSRSTAAAGMETETGCDR